MAGFTDKPTTQDIFGIERYITGLTDFITECNTPMTIAIQGDWGTGKTSIMEMIKARLELRGHVKSVWFNTWQFSQFNMGDELALSLLNHLMDELKIDGSKSYDNMKKVLKFVSGVVKKAGVIVIDKVAGGDFADAANELLRRNNENIDLPKAIGKLKEDFQNCVRDALSKNKGKPAMDRVVIFIDDLDRLQPKRAVELLEVLKLFLDCENCVFVLAIDYGVVSRGVEEKYGEGFSEEKGKSFFDKIIQVPFKMPVANYNINNFVKNMLNEINISIEDDQVKIYESLIETSVGYNPRSMKRLFNAYFLLTKVVPEEFLSSDWKKQLLFAILCMQQSFETVYNQIVRKRDDLTIDTLYALSGDGEGIIEGQFDIDDNTKDKLAKFMIHFVKVIDKDQDQKITIDDLSEFKSVLGFSTITAAKDISEESGRSMKKAVFKFKGNIYKSRAGNNRNIGYLAHDMIAEYASRPNHLPIDEFIETLRNNWKTNGWLRYIVIKEEEKAEKADIANEHAYLLKDTDAIQYDNDIIYVAKYWGAADIDKLRGILKIEDCFENVEL